GTTQPDPSRHHRQGRRDPPAHPDRPGPGQGPRPRLRGHRLRHHRDREGNGRPRLMSSAPATDAHHDIVRDEDAGPVTGVLVSDVDSTFLTQEVIELVADHAGTRAEVEEVTTRAMRGELDFAASLHARVA